MSTAAHQIIQESVTAAIGLIATVQLFLDHTGTLDCKVRVEEDVRKTSQANVSDESTT